MLTKFAKVRGNITIATLDKPFQRILPQLYLDGENKDCCISDTLMLFVLVMGIMDESIFTCQFCSFENSTQVTI